MNIFIQAIFYTKLIKFWIRKKFNQIGIIALLLLKEGSLIKAA